jgi:hypothetical protein
MTTPPRARTNDVDTSHGAARMAEHVQHNHRQLALDALEDIGRPATARDIQEHIKTEEWASDSDAETARKRVSELVRDGELFRVGTDGRAYLVWFEQRRVKRFKRL